MFSFDLQLFGGGGKGGSSSSSSYTPSAQEVQLQQYALDNANTANTGVKSLINQFNSGVQSEQFGNILGDSSNQISQGQSNLTGLSQGQLPSGYQEGMTEAVRKTLSDTLGNNINDLAGKGVINSSVANKAINDISANAADSVAKSYDTNVGTSANISNALISNATAGYKPYSDLQNLGITQQNAYVTSPLSAISGKGTTTTEQSGAGLGDMLTSIGLGLGTGWAGSQMGIYGKK